jgi:hypothetical protein
MLVKIITAVTLIVLRLAPWNKQGSPYLSLHCPKSQGKYRGITTISIGDLIGTQHYDAWFKNRMSLIIMLSVAFSYCYADLHYAECCYAECHGASTTTA